MTDAAPYAAQAIHHKRIVATLGYGVIALFLLSVAISVFYLLEHSSPPLVFAIYGLCVSLYIVLTIVFVRETRKQMSLWQQSIDENERLLEESRAHNDQIYVAAEIARDISALNDLDELLQRSVQLIVERFGFYHAAIFLLDEGGDYATLRVAAGTTPSSAALVAQGHRMQVGGVGIIGYVTATARYYLANDAHNDPTHHANPSLPETQAEMAVPLTIRGRVIGALDVQSQRLGQFSTTDVRLFQSLADLLAIAIENTRLSQAVRQQNVDLEEQVAARTSELAKANRELNTILDAIHEGLIYIEEGRGRYVNAAFTALTGYDLNDVDVPDKLLAHAIDLEENHAVLADVSRSYHHEGFWSRELRLRRKTGEEFDAEVTIVAVRDEKGQPVGALTTFRDISQQKALEEHKSRFVDYASHELRTPIANLKTRLFLLDRQPHKFREHIQVIHSVTARMQRIVDDLLTISRFQRGLITLDTVPIALQDVLEEVVNLAAHDAEQKGLRLSLELPAEPLIVTADRDRMIQVVTNLVGNAIKYTKEGHVIVRLVRQDDQALIEVEDSGVGIPADAADSIFQPFYRADNVAEPGHGLGLNVSKHIVELHGGRISFRNAQPQGTIFSVALPHRESAATS
ncbi:MAG: ATP-binding protein [Anaerolineae bacterium]|nr:ATP-binding protein [Anaerolineae bacterium]MDW8172343.1 ATP-binding protein [Anaerolineae bacterium]